MKAVIDMFDSHLHTNNSPDAMQSIDELCLAAIQNNLSGISICDHAEVSLFHMADFFELIKGSVRDTERARIKYGDSLKILQGIEISEFFWDDSKVKTFLSLGNYDVILGSVHRVDCIGHTDSYSRVDMKHTPHEHLHKFISIYFDDMVRMIRGYDFDVLSHLTVPLRYINGKYGRNVDISPYTDKIEEILDLIIKKGIALEVNTSGIGTNFDDFFPDENIIRKYKSMGGELITIGSDAHTSDRVGYGIDKAKKLLSDIGFRCYHYYEKRKPVEVLIK